jgi:hypothetical protein
VALRPGLQALDLGRRHALALAGVACRDDLAGAIQWRSVSRVTPIAFAASAGVMSAIARSADGVSCARAAPARAI